MLRDCKRCAKVGQFFLGAILVQVFGLGVLVTVVSFSFVVFGCFFSKRHGPPILCSDFCLDCRFCFAWWHF